MVLNRTRFAVVLLGDRLCVAAVQGSRVHAFVVESEQPVTALRAELDARHLAPRTVAIGLPRAAVTVKPVELPALGTETREMVRFELERHLPFATEDAAFDFVPLAPSDVPEFADQTGPRVLLAAADRRVVDTALRIVQDAKVRPRSVTVASHDLVALARPLVDARVVWIHRVDDSLDLLFVTGDGVVMSRTLPVVDDAALATEIRRSFALVKWRGCDAIWISGDATAPAAPTDSPLADLGAPVTAPAYTLAAERALATLEGPRGALELAVAVAFAPASRPLDLLPPALRPFRLTRPQLATAGVAVASALIVIAALMVPGYRDGRRLAALNSQIAGLDAEVRTVEAMLKELDGKRRLLTTVDTLEASALRPLPVMRELTELLPNDAWLTLLSMDVKGVELTGQANAASALIPLLENSNRFERVEFASPVTRGRDREQFRIQAAWEVRAPAAPAPRAAAAGPAAPAPVASSPAVAPPPATPAERPAADAQLPPLPRRPTPPEGRR
jgi:Tfp pilus assembly protein PilN